MWDKCSKYCRMIILSIIILVTSMIMVYNKKYIKIENFTNPVSKDSIYVNNINKVYKESLARNAYAFEIEELKKQMKDENDLRKVFEIVSKTEEYIEKQNLDEKIMQNIGTASNNEEVGKTLDSMTIKDRMAIYRDVIDMYVKILDRLPNINELNYYSYRITETSGFDKRNLETILLSSTERKIIEKNQTNLVNVEVNGRMTEAEIRFNVNELYKKVLNRQDDPTEILAVFLQKKYIDYQMDEDKLSDLIILLEMVDNNKIRDTIETTSEEAAYNNMNNNVDANGNIIDIMNTFGIECKNVDSNKIDCKINRNNNSVNNNSTDSNVNNSNVNVNNVNNNSVNNNSNVNVNNNSNDKSIEEYKKDLQAYLQILKDKTQEDKKCPISNKNANNNYKNANKDPFYESLQCINNGAFDIQQKDDLLSTYQMDRNKSSLGENCKRNNKYLNADDDMILFPEFKWSVPQRRPPVCYFDNTKNINPSVDQTALIGTLLTDAENTNVGSIMPSFVFKELTN